MFSILTSPIPICKESVGLSIPIPILEFAPVNIILPPLICNLLSFTILVTPIPIPPLIPVIIKFPPLICNLVFG